MLALLQGAQIASGCVDEDGGAHQPENRRQGGSLRADGGVEAEAHPQAVGEGGRAMSEVPLSPSEYGYVDEVGERFDAAWREGGRPRPSREPRSTSSSGARPAPA